MDQDLEKIENLKKNQDKFIEDLLNEAIEHKYEPGVKLLKQVISGDDTVDANTNMKNILTGNKQIPEKHQKKIVENDYPDIDYDLNNDEDDTYIVDDFDIPHDLVPLPSKGLVYKNVKSKIPVAYLTASDEDLITSPNLYLDGKIIDLLLRKKILDTSIKPENLCKGDRDAIIVWLRATGYGAKFPLMVKDPISGESFDYEIDLSALKVKDFDLTPDTDGYFDYKLPKSGHIVKFRFLTHKDEINYTKLLEKINPNFKKLAIKNSISSITDIIGSETKLDSKLKTSLALAIESLNEYFKVIDDTNDNLYLKNVTFLLERSIVSINGNSDRNYIKKYVSIMPVSDSLALRKHINENTPGVDFKTTIERPESLGGGSFDTFLELDSTVFLHIT